MPLNPTNQTKHLIYFVLLPKILDTYWQRLFFLVIVVVQDSIVSWYKLPVFKISPLKINGTRRVLTEKLYIF